MLASYQAPEHDEELKWTLVCSVFDSGSNQWREFASLQDDCFTHMNKNQVVFVHGALHWLTDSYCRVLMLDLDNDRWRKMTLPMEVGWWPRNKVYLLEYHWLLSVILISKTWMKVWVLRDYDLGVWHLVDRANLRHLRGLVPGIFPISQTRDNVLLATSKQIWAYQRKTGVWKQMFSVNSGFTLPLWLSAYLYRSTIFHCH